MPKYDSTKDKVIEEWNIQTSAAVMLVIGVYKYGDNNPKIGVTRKIVSEEFNEGKWAKLGRMSKDEVKLLIPELQKAVDIIEKLKEVE